LRRGSRRRGGDTLSPLGRPADPSKIHDLAEEVKTKSGHLSEEWKDKASVYIEKGKEFVEQKKSALSSAFDAGRRPL
jgi:hypothetical protein